MKVGIYNSSLENSTVAQISAAILADALANTYETEIVACSAVPLREQLSVLTGRLIERVAFHKVEDPPQFVTDPTRPDSRYQALRDWSDNLTRRYDLFINFTDRLPIHCAAERGVLVIQFPHDFIPTFYRTLWLDHLASYQLKLVNSYYTRFWTRLFWELDGVVVYPPITTPGPAAQKENLILTVGSFNTSGSNAQLELISAFGQLKRQLQDWSFSVIGRVDSNRSSKRYFETALETGRSSGIPVFANASRSEELELFKRAKIFWQAAGVGEDLDYHPQRAEPFNLAAVQAMAAGCVPVVTNAGGLAEIIRQGETGFFWNTREELLAYTLTLAGDESLRLKLARAAKQRAFDFRSENYVDSFLRQLQTAFGFTPSSPGNRFWNWKRFVNSATQFITSRR